MKTLVLAKEHTAYLAAKIATMLDSNNNSNCRLLYFSYAELFYNFPSISDVRKVYNNVDQLLSLNDIYQLPESDKKRGIQIHDLDSLLRSKGYSIANARLASQFFSQSFHQRDYYFPVGSNFEQSYILYTWERIGSYFREENISRVISLNNDTIETYLIDAYCSLNNISYNYLEYTRVQGLWWWNDNGSIRFPSTLKIPTEIDYVPSFSSQGSEWADYRNNNTLRVDLSIKQWVIEVLQALKLTTKLEIYKLTHGDYRKELLASNFKYLRYCVRKYFRYRRFKNIIRGRVLKSHQLAETKYFYFPLHYVPESTVFTSCPQYFDQLSVIKMLSKEIQPDEVILLKEHGQMLGETDPTFYEAVSKLKNVFWIDRSEPISNAEIINNCAAVITLSGSSALEAAECGKASMIFGYAPFEKLNCVVKHSGDLSTDLDRLRFLDNGNENRGEFIKYEIGIKEFSSKLDLISIFAMGKDILVNSNEVYDNQVFSILEKLPKQ